MMRKWVKLLATALAGLGIFALVWHLKHPILPFEFLGKWQATEVESEGSFVTRNGPIRWRKKTFTFVAPTRIALLEMRNELSRSNWRDVGSYPTGWNLRRGPGSEISVAWSQYIHPDESFFSVEITQIYESGRRELPWDDLAGC